MRAPDSTSDDGQPLIRLATDALGNDWLRLTGIAMLAASPSVGVSMVFASMGVSSPTWTAVPVAILMFVGHAAIAHRVAEMASGRSAPVVTVLRQTVSRFVPLAVLAVLVLPLLVLGYACLVLPGLLASACLLPVAPACVAEGLGPVEAIRRSALLTARSRGRLAKAAAGLGIVYLLFAFPCLVAAILLAGVLNPSPSQAFFFAPVLGGWLLQAGGLLVASALSGVAYVWLKGRQADEPRQF